MQAKNQANTPSTAVWAGFVAMLVLVLITYANHFNNSFHFDDFHTISDNPWIRDPGNIPRFFTDARTFSTLPPNRTYRPLVTTSLAVDYWLGHGLTPLWFHISTFFWFLIQLTLMFLLFRNILDRVRPGARNPWIALIATAIYGTHPVSAETVNYIIQRGDIYSTLGAVAGLAVYALAPRLRRFGLYLLPVIAGVLSKPQAAVFPALLWLFIWLFEEDDVWKALRKSAPAFVVIGAAAVFSASMNPPSYVAGATSAWAYRVSQPAVLRDYFRKFFIPAGLSADTDRLPSQSLFDADALTGFLFIAVLCAGAWWAMKVRERRPIAFGLAWFLITSLPTSLIALAEVENDHRMYFPFAGLTLAVCWAIALWIEQRRISSKLVATVCALVLTGLAWGARERNLVWSTDETLWHDVTIKSPKNGRGLMNYGLAQMSKGNYAGALDSFQRALIYNPNYYILEINLGVVYGATNRPLDAEQHFARAVQLAPLEAIPHYYYARWLRDVHRTEEAASHLEAAVRLNPDDVAAHYLLMQIYADAGDAPKLRAEAAQMLVRFPSDATAKSYLVRSASLKPAPAATPAAPGSAESYLNQSLSFYLAHKYPECIAAAEQALKRRPDYPEAWNNIAASYNSMSRWDEGIAAADKAIRLKPDFPLARNNRAWAVSEKNKLAKK